MTHRKRNDYPKNFTKEELLRALTEGNALKKLMQTLRTTCSQRRWTEPLLAGKGERTAGRLRYHSGHYSRSLVTRVDKLELRVPQNRQGRYSTELFDRF